MSKILGDIFGTASNDAKRREQKRREEAEKKCKRRSKYYHCCYDCMCFYEVHEDVDGYEYGKCLLRDNRILPLREDCSCGHYKKNN